jgi:glycosyltransferase involved in cell wall biosynthesis
MFMSLIICTKNRAAQLDVCLKKLAAALPPPCEMEVVLVDNGSTDATAGVIEQFAAALPFKVTRAYDDKPGLGLARNVGLAAARGEWLLFTDDDCYVETDFFRNFFDFVNLSAASDGQAKEIRYGSGPVLPFDEHHDPRIASLAVEKIKLIAAKTLMGAGAIQGANMFFHRSVFTSVGGFNARMGSGTPFACEDIEMAARASLAGFLGAQVPFFKVTHHHKRLIGSVEAQTTVESYDFGRGAYYASLMDQGIPQVWRLWEAGSQLQNMVDPKFRERLVRELEGAARYLEALPAMISPQGGKPATSPATPAPNGQAGKASSAGG